ncbi:Calcium/proton exchanger, partial [Aureobasidium melanogenum]
MRLRTSVCIYVPSDLLFSQLHMGHSHAHCIDERLMTLSTGNNQSYKISPLLETLILWDFFNQTSRCVNLESCLPCLKDLLGAPDRTKTDNSDPARSNTGDTMKKRRPKIGIVSQFKTTLLGSWVDVLLVCVPVGFALRYTHANGYAVFIVNFLAIISLAAMLSFATEELALYTGETLGGLLNASFGNATELIVSIIALAQNKILILQTSLIGSMRSNSLLVLGMCFSFGGINRLVQHFNVAVAQTASSMLAVLIGSLIIPTAFQRLGNNPAGGVAPISRGTAIILLLVYFAYLIFQLKTHVEIYNTLSQRNKKNRRSTRENGGTLMGIARIGAGRHEA